MVSIAHATVLAVVAVLCVAPLTVAGMDLDANSTAIPGMAMRATVALDGHANTTFAKVFLPALESIAEDFVKIGVNTPSAIAANGCSSGVALLACNSTHPCKALVLSGFDGYLRKDITHTDMVSFLLTNPLAEEYFEVDASGIRVTFGFVCAELANTTDAEQPTTNSAIEAALSVPLRLGSAAVQWGSAFAHTYANGRKSKATLEVLFNFTALAAHNVTLDPNARPANNDKKSSKLSGGEVAAIILVSICVTGLIVGYFGMRRKMREDKEFEDKHGKPDLEAGSPLMQHYKNLQKYGKQ